MPRRLVAATLLLTVTLVSCQTWTPLEGVRDPVPDEVRVGLASDDTIRVRDSVIEDHLLVGASPSNPRAILRIPLADITSMEWHRPDLRRTWIAIGLGAGFLAIVAWQVAHNFEVGF